MGNSSDEPVSDLTYLKTAIRRAKRYGLLWEFRDAYRAYRREGDSVQTAAWCALYDWDMLDIVGYTGLGLVPDERDRQTS